MKPIKKGEQKNIFNSVDALDKLKVFRGRIPTNFDFKQELASARDEKKTTASEKIFQKAIADKAMVFCFGRVGEASPGVAGAESEHPQ